MKRTKLLRMILILVFVLSLAVGLSSCSCKNSSNEPSDMEKFQSKVKEVAKEYYSKHYNYENFDNTTYMYESFEDNTEVVKIEYKENLNAESTIKGNYTNVYNTHKLYKVQVYNVKEDVVSVTINYTETITSKVFGVDNDSLLTETDSVREKAVTYKYLTLDIDDVTKYYLTYEKVEKENNEVTDTIRQYRVYDGQGTYRNNVQNVLTRLNRDVIREGYFELSMGEIILFYGNLLEYDINSDNYKGTFNYTSFGISDSDVYDITAKYEINFVNNGLGAINVKSTRVNDTRTDQINGTCTITLSADDIDLNFDLENYTEYYYLSIDTSYLPEVNMSFFSL